VPIKKRRFILLAFLLAGCGAVFALIAITGTTPRVSASDFAASPIFADPTPSSSEGPWIVRAYFYDQTQVARVAERMEPWEVDNSQNLIILEANSEQIQWLRGLGLRVEIDPIRTAELYAPRLALPGQASGIIGYPCYRTVEETYATAEQLASEHPTLASWIDVGDTWKRTEFGTESGHDMRVLRLTNTQIPGPKPILFVLSSIHAREYAPAELNTRFGETLVSNYGIDPDITWLLDYHEIHLLLQGNPDGRERAEEGISWRKNTNNNYCADTIARGVDLNRNFEFQWGCCGGSSTDTCDQTYRGPIPGSEPETQAIQDYVRSLFPDQRDDPIGSPAPDDTTGVFIDLHSYGELVLWPWGFTSSQPPNSSDLRTLGRKFAYFNDYTPEQAINLYPTDGTTDDFAYGELGLAAYTIELGTWFFQDCLSFETTIYPDNLTALVYAAKVARTPYQTPSGPDSLSVTISPSLTISGSLASINARIDDTRIGNGETTQNITTAEYYIDTPPWITSTGLISGTLDAVDGAFDQKIEIVSAVHQMNDLPIGKHIVWVRGKDSANNWGPFSATFLVIVEKQFYLPLIRR
jgi:hypothetical protein